MRQKVKVHVPDCVRGQVGAVTNNFRGAEGRSFPAALPPESAVSRRVEHIAEQVTESARAHSYYSS